MFYKGHLRISFFCLLLVVASGGAIYGVKKTTDGFRPAKCLIQWPLMPEWETPALDDSEILAQLEKPFSYFAQGNQSYVFLSQNGKFVLKLFRFNTCPIPYGRLCENTVRSWLGKYKRRLIPARTRILKNFNSCKLAYTLAKRETGVLYVHLNPKKGTLPTIRVKDHLGRSHKIDPARYRFVLQEKAEPMIQTLAAHADNMEPWIQEFHDLMKNLSDLGLVNLDPKIGSNFGYLDGRAIQIDFGNFIYCPEGAAANRLLFEKIFSAWLNKPSTQGRIYEASVAAF